MKDADLPRRKTYTSRYPWLFYRPPPLNKPYFRAGTSPQMPRLSTWPFFFFKLGRKD